jgi:FkbM family methyltransferase
LRNTRHQQRIRTIRAAVWHRSEDVVIVNEDADPWGYQVKSADEEGTTIQGLTISMILKQYGLEEIDLLRLDIEGAEKEIFSASERDLNWMNRTHAIMIELHDHVRPGSKTAFLHAAKRFGFEISQRTMHNVVAERTP